jgi:hypothetical protein
MADELVEHRFVQIYQASEKASFKLEEFWNSLAQISTIAVSHGCEKVYARVTQNKDLDLLQTIQNLQNLILTNNDSTKNTVFLRTITRLLIFNQGSSDKKKILFHHCKTDSQQVHPYTMIMREKPILYHGLLEEVDYLISNELPVAIPTLNGFISAIFLTENKFIDSSAILFRFTSAIMTIGTYDDNILTALYACISHILFKYPLQKEDGIYFSLVDFLMWTTIISKPYQELKADRDAISTSDYIYSFVDRLLTTSSKGYSVINYLTRLESMINSANNSFTDVIWVSLCFVLLRSKTIDEQQAIMRLMKLIYNRTSSSVSRIAYLPFYQLLSELNDKDASKELKALKDNTLLMLAELDNNKNSLCLNEKLKQHVSGFLIKCLFRLSNVFPIVTSYCKE